jgi:hypothetical protein
MPAPLPLAGNQHRSGERTVELRYLSERKEQGFHIRYWVGEPEMESRGDFRFPYPSQRVEEEPEVNPRGLLVAATPSYPVPPTGGKPELAALSVTPAGEKP